MWMRWGRLVMLLVLLSGPAARAAEDDNDRERARVRRSSTILLSSDPAERVAGALPKAPWQMAPWEMAPWLLENLRLDKRGLKYVGRFGQRGQNRIVLRVRGPIMRRDQFGVKVDIRF